MWYGSISYFYNILSGLKEFWENYILLAYTPNSLMDHQFNLWFLIFFYISRMILVWSDFKLKVNSWRKLWNNEIVSYAVYREVEICLCVLFACLFFFIYFCLYFVLVFFKQSRFKDVYTPPVLLGVRVMVALNTISIALAPSWTGVAYTSLKMHSYYCYYYHYFFYI